MSRFKKQVANGRPRMRDFSTKEVFHRKSGGRLLEKKNPGNLLRGRLSRCFLCASRRFSGGSWSFRCSGTRHSVVAGAVVGAGVAAGVTVSVFCSQAARSAAPARMQMYFFIVGDAYCFNRSIAASAVFGPRRMLLETQMARHETKTVAPISSHAPRLRPCK